MSALVLVGPADRQVPGRGDVVVDDRLIAHRRSDHAIAALRQSEQSLVQAGSGKKDLVTDVEHGVCQGSVAVPVFGSGHGFLGRPDLTSVGILAGLRKHVEAEMSFAAT